MAISLNEPMTEAKRVIAGICGNYEGNGECHARPYEPGVGIVPDPSLVEYGTGGPNFLVSRDAWCKARHGTANWKEKKVSAELEAAQKPCSRYEKGWPRTEDNQNLFNENGEWVVDIDEAGATILQWNGWVAKRKRVAIPSNGFSSGD